MSFPRPFRAKYLLLLATCLAGFTPTLASAQVLTENRDGTRSPTLEAGVGQLDVRESVPSGRVPIHRWTGEEPASSPIFVPRNDTSNPNPGGSSTVGSQGVTTPIGMAPPQGTSVSSTSQNGPTSPTLSTTTPAPAALIVPQGRALPTGGQVVYGGVNFDTSRPDTLSIVQSTDRAITSWATFDIGAGYNVVITQPGATSVMLARVRGDTPSLIAGQLTANGRVVLINPNGIVVGAGGRIDAGSFVASTLDIADTDFLRGNLTFRRAGKPATIVNQGTINAENGIALVSSGIVNEGAVSARLGRIGYGAGDMVTVDFAGDQFLSIAIPVSDATGLTDVLGRPLDALIRASGTTRAEGGQIYLSAQVARDLMMGAVKVDGDLIATTVRTDGDGQIKLGSVVIDGGNGLVQVVGNVAATGGQGLSGGSINISGGAVALGGSITASGGVNGGVINVSASRVLSLADSVSATGATGRGGSITYTSGGNINEIQGSATDAFGGLHGGTIVVTAVGDLASSGVYRASGLIGLGGRIDMTGANVRLLSTYLEARGGAMGGLIRIGGAFQGGADGRFARSDYGMWEGRFGALPSLANASETFVNDGVNIDVSASRGAGGDRRYLVRQANNHAGRFGGDRTARRWFCRDFRQRDFAIR